MDLELPKDFREFLRLLRAHGVEYLLIGGWAVGYHGYPRFTDDLDIWIAVSATNAERVVNVFSDFGFDLPGLTTELFLEDNKIVRVGVEPIRIEVMTSIDGVHFEDCYRDRLEIDLEGIQVSLINLAHLRLNKKASGRLKDLSDLENLPEN
jgi:predicted nucleotidyltransferase